MARAVSTVLDVTLCLLLIGAAVATLAFAVSDTEGTTTPDADGTAGILATATASVPSAGEHRTGHDTLAGHLGRAAVTNASIGDEELTESNYPAAVVDETASVTPRRTAITARWKPYPDSPLVGAAHVGAEPPPEASVAVTTMTLDSGIESPQQKPDSFETLSRRLAETYIAWLFPPERTRARLVDRRTAPPTAERYQAVAEPMKTDISEPLAGANTRAANDVLAAALATELEADLQKRYDTPTDAHEDVRIDAVEVVVRRWEP